MRIPIACRGLGDTSDGVWHSCQQRACLDWALSLHVCVVPCWLTDSWGQGFAGMWADGCLPWLWVVPEAGRAWILWFQLWVHSAAVSSCVMGSSVGECSSELQTKLWDALVHRRKSWLNSRKQFKCFLSYRVPRCWSLALVPSLSAWLAVGCLWFHPSHAGSVCAGGAGWRPEDFGYVL